jgi:hypothetical protein
MTTPDPEATEATEPDTCRPVEVDGQSIRVRGSGQMTPEAEEALAALVRVAKTKFVADAPEKVGELQQKLRLAHKARRAKEHQLDGIRRALCDAGFMEEDDPYGHADLDEVIRQAGTLLERIRADVRGMCNCCLTNRDRLVRIRRELGIADEWDKTEAEVAAEDEAVSEDAEGSR